MIIHPYKRGSRGARRLKEALNASKKMAWVLTREPAKKSCLVVNWGSPTMKFPTGQHVLVNDPFYTCVLADKKQFFEKVGHHADFLEWTTNPVHAMDWKAKVFARQLTRASGGRGILVWDYENPDKGPLPAAPLYTKHQPKTAEYRFHMARSLTGETFHPILVQRKVFVKTPERELPTSWDVRNHDNGFIFQSHPDLTKIPQEAQDVARRVMEEHFSELHFCALDVLYHKTTNRAVVAEGNTAPGLENDTVNIYANYFRELNDSFLNSRRY